MNNKPQDLVGDTKPGYPEHPFPSRLTQTVRDNLERNRRELESGAVRLESRPIVAWVAFTGVCNLACSHCDRLPEMRGRGEDMDQAVFEKLCDQLFPFVERIFIGGNNLGEQLLTKNWDSMLDRLAEFPLILDVLTNGTVLNERRIRQLVAAHATVNISLEGITPETYEASRGQSLDKLLARVEALAAERARYPDNKTRIQFGFTTYYDNIRELPQLIQRSSELGVDRVEVHHLFPAFEHQRYQSLVYHRTLTNEMFDQATDLARSLGVELRLPRRFEESSMIGEAANDPDENKRLDCPLPWIATSISENGDVAPCCGASSKVLGNLRHKDFEDIWNGRAYQSLRRTVNSDKPWQICAVCPSVWRGLNHKDENVLRAIGLAETEKPPLVHLKAFVKGVLERGELGRRLLETYRRNRRSRGD